MEIENVPFKLVGFNSENLRRVRYDIVDPESGCTFTAWNTYSGTELIESVVCDEHGDYPPGSDIYEAVQEYLAGLGDIQTELNKENKCTYHSYCQKADDGEWFCPKCGESAPDDGVDRDRQD